MPDRGLSSYVEKAILGPAASNLCTSPQSPCETKFLKNLFGKYSS